MKKKIKKSVVKRFKITKKGKVLFSHQYSRHLRIKKTERRKRRQAEPGVLTGTFAKKIKKMLGKA